MSLSLSSQLVKLRGSITTTTGYFPTFFDIFFPSALDCRSWINIKFMSNDGFDKNIFDIAYNFLLRFALRISGSAVLQNDISSDLWNFDENRFRRNFDENHFRRNFGENHFENMINFHGFSGDFDSIVYHNFIGYFLNELFCALFCSLDSERFIMVKMVMRRFAMMILDCICSDKVLKLALGRGVLSGLVNGLCVRTLVNEFRNDVTTGTATTIPTSSSTPADDTDDHMYIHIPSEAKPSKHPPEQFTHANTHTQPTFTM